MMHWVRTVLRKIAAAWAKRRHDGSTRQIENKMVADLEAILANMKREREQVNVARTRYGARLPATYICPVIDYKIAEQCNMRHVSSHLP